MSAIWAEGLTKHFDEVRAVDGIDLDIAPGAIFGFLGQNGSGKTTTIRMLTTLLRPTAGKARVDGLDILDDARAVRNRIGVALQEAGLDDIQTGRELLTLQARLFGLRGGARRQRIEELLAIVDLEDAADRAVGTYSGGMKRRLDLAAALVHRPGIIFLDEPTTGLDPVSREGIWRYVNRLSVEDGITVFLTTQYLEEADRLAHDLAIIDEGRIIARGSPAEMKASIGTDVVTVEVEASEALDRAAEVATALPAVERVQIADGAAVVYVPDGARAVARIVIALDDAGIEVGNVSISRPSLDDVFLEATGPPPAGRGTCFRRWWSGLMHSLATIYFLTVRSLREAVRNPAQEVGNIFVPLFFFAVTVGSIGSIAADAFGIDNFTGFQVPVAILSAASSISASAGLGTITDIQRGYFDKLLLTPAPRSAIVLGRITADGVRSIIITGVIVVVGLLFRTGFDTGVLGVLLLLAGSFFFGMAYSGFNAAVALRTGSPQAAAAGGLLLFPLIFLSTAFAPKEVFADWLQVLATINPITYILEAQRSLIIEGWNWLDLLRGAAAILGFGMASFTLTFLALRWRTS